MTTARIIHGGASLHLDSNAIIEDLFAVQAQIWTDYKNESDSSIKADHLQEHNDISLELNTLNDA